MKLLVHVFSPKTYLLHYQHRLATSHEQQDKWPINQTSAPIGLMGVSSTDLKEICRDHIEEMVDNPEYAAQVTASDTNQTPYAILEAAQQYYKSTEVCIDSCLKVSGED